MAQSPEELRLIEGEPDDPEVGRDGRGTSYRFGYEGDVGEHRRALFELAQRISAAVPGLEGLLSDFMREAVREQSGIEEAPARVDSFAIGCAARSGCTPTGIP